MVMVSYIYSSSAGEMVGERKNCDSLLVYSIYMLRCYRNSGCVLTIFQKHRSFDRLLQRQPRKATTTSTSDTRPSVLSCFIKVVI
jgi:hypothetical protein